MLLTVNSGVSGNISNTNNTPSKALAGRSDDSAIVGHVVENDGETNDGVGTSKSKQIKLLSLLNTAGIVHQPVTLRM